MAECDVKTNESARSKYCIAKRGRGIANSSMVLLITGPAWPHFGRFWLGRFTVGPRHPKGGPYSLMVHRNLCWGRNRTPSLCENYSGSRDISEPSRHPRVSAVPSVSVYLPHEQLGVMLYLLEKWNASLVFIIHECEELNGFPWQFQKPVTQVFPNPLLTYLPPAGFTSRTSHLLGEHVITNWLAGFLWWAAPGVYTYPSLSLILLLGTGGKRWGADSGLRWQWNISRC